MPPVGPTDVRGDPWARGAGHWIEAFGDGGGGTEGLTRSFVSGRLAEEVKSVEFQLTDGTAVQAQVVEGPSEPRRARRLLLGGVAVQFGEMHGRLGSVREDGGRAGRSGPGARAATSRSGTGTRPATRTDRHLRCASVGRARLASGVRSDGVVEPTYYVQIADPEEPERWYTVARVRAGSWPTRSFASRRAPTCGRRSWPSRTTVARALSQSKLKREKHLAHAQWELGMGEHRQ